MSAVRIKKTNTKNNTYPPPLPGSTSLHPSRLLYMAHNSTRRMEDGCCGWCITVSFFHSFLLTLFLCSILGPSYQLQSFRINPLHGTWILHGLQRIAALELGAPPTPPSLSLIFPLLFLTLFCSLLLSLPCVICLFLNMFSQQHHQLPRDTTNTLDWPSFGTLWVCCRGDWNWLELAVTNTGKPLVSPHRGLCCSPPTTRTLP